MDRHAWRRVAVAASFTTLVAMGIQHPGNAVLQPGMIFGGFAILFAVTTVGLAAYFEYGARVFRRAWRFIRTSEALVILVGIFVAALTMIGAASWPEMMLWQRVVFPVVAVFGLVAAFWEHLTGVAPEVRDRRHAH